MGGSVAGGLAATAVAAPGRMGLAATAEATAFAILFAVGKAFGSATSSDDDGNCGAVDEEVAGLLTSCGSIDTSSDFTSADKEEWLDHQRPRRATASLHAPSPLTALSPRLVVSFTPDWRIGWTTGGPGVPLRCATPTLHLLGNWIERLSK